MVAPAEHRPGVMGRNRTRILLYVIAAAAGGRHPSIRELSELIGGTCDNSAQGHLAALRREGLVAWGDPDRPGVVAGTIRPTCTFTPA